MSGQIPPIKGSYLLCCHLPVFRKITIGRLGTFDFPAGRYYYAGSARGPGGIKARVRHHLRVSPCPTWHMDYLRPSLQIFTCIYAPGVLIPECEWLRRIEKSFGGEFPAPGFGASDCRAGCPAHLFYSSSLPDSKFLLDSLAVPDARLEFFQTITQVPTQCEKYMV